MLAPEVLRQYTPLHNLTDANLTRLARRLRVEEVATGTVLCREGDTDNDALYLLDGGVELRSQATSMVRVLRVGMPDALFPVAAGRPRPYTVTAAGAVRVFRLDNAVLDRAVMLDTVSTTITQLRDGGNTVLAGDGEWLEEMMASPVFQRLPRERLALLLLRLEGQPVKAGEAVVRQGEAGEYYYVVRDGRFAVTRKDAHGKVQVLSELKRGAVFGEAALLFDAPQNASVIALADGVVMRLPRTEFEKLLKQPLIQYLSRPEAEALVRAGGVLLDVRTAAEFQHGSLPGAVNMPVAELRARLGELDAQRDYVLLCRDGTQSEAVAFLLGQRGYRMAVLRGGLRGLQPG